MKEKSKQTSRCKFTATNYVLPLLFLWFKVVSGRILLPGKATPMSLDHSESNQAIFHVFIYMAWGMKSSLPASSSTM